MKRIPYSEPLTIDRLADDFRGISHINGKVVFIEGALPGETVNIDLIKQRRRANEAIATEILTNSDDRVTPPCRFFGTCGGCRLQHLSVDAQLGIKQQMFAQQLEHHLSLKDFQLDAALTGPTEGYRRRARLGVRFVPKKDQVIVGFRERHSNYLTLMDSCQVLHPAIGQQLQALQQLLYDFSHRDQIPQIEVSVADNHTVLTFRNLVDLTNAEKQALIDFGKQQQWVILLQPNKPKPLQVLTSDHMPDFYYDIPSQHIRIYFKPLDFIQVNANINDQMISQALKWLELSDTDTVLDLFSGLGNFSLPMAKKVKHILGIEGADSLVQGAADNAMHNGISNTVFQTADLDQHFDIPPWGKQYFDIIVLDPPRSGAEKLISHLINSGANKILYVSCNVATFIRDAKMLLDSGKYRLARAGIMDMFPHTAHVESMALFING